MIIPRADHSPPLCSFLSLLCLALFSYFSNSLFASSFVLFPLACSLSSTLALTKHVDATENPWASGTFLILLLGPAGFGAGLFFAELLQFANINLSRFQQVLLNISDLSLRADADTQDLAIFTFSSRQRLQYFCPLTLGLT